MPKPTGKNTEKDYGKRLYIGDESFFDKMKQQTIAYYDELYKQRQSESKKPYKEDDYPSMEYHWDPWDPKFPPWEPPDTPPTTTYTPPPPVVGPPPPTYNPGGGKKPEIPPFLGCDFWSPFFNPIVISPGEWALTKFYIGAEETGIREIEVSGPVDLVGMDHWKGMTGPKDQASFGENWMMVVAWDQDRIMADPHYNNVEGDIFYMVTFRTNSYFAPKELPPAPGSSIPRSNPWADFGVCTCRGYVRVCDETNVPTWDTDISPATIGRNDRVQVAVKDGQAPYRWNVEGTGFTLDSEKTTLRTNYLNSDNTACGMATITVTDACGKKVTGKVKCTYGTWGDVFCGCPMLAPHNTTIYGLYAFIIDDIKCIEGWEQTYGGGADPDPLQKCIDYNCAGRCSTWSYCQDDCGCDPQCVTDSFTSGWLSGSVQIGVECMYSESAGAVNCICKGELSGCWQWKCS